MSKARRKPRPEMPHWFWLCQDECWFCRNKNNCSSCKINRTISKHTPKLTKHRDLKAKQKLDHERE